MFKFIAVLTNSVFSSIVSIFKQYSRLYIIISQEYIKVEAERGLEKYY